MQVIDSLYEKCFLPPLMSLKASFQLALMDNISILLKENTLDVTALCPSNK